jgi:glycerophosphoryl diester phosphodiesterase
VTAPAWLTARPIAHRGLHDRAAGRIENSTGAALAAIEKDFAIECDVQLSSDGEAMVFHDFSLERLTGETGKVAERTARELGAIELAGSNDRIVSLAAFLDLIAGRTPLVVEIKSRFEQDLRLARRVAEVVRGRPAPIAIKSFDPDVIAFLQGRRTDLGLQEAPLGIVAEADYGQADWKFLSYDRQVELPNLLHFESTRPDFLSWRVDDLPHAAPHLFRVALGRPVMTWTVRTPEQRARAARWADQMVFEGFTP